MGLYPMQERVDDMSQLLGLPETVVPLGVIAVGFPAQIPPPMDTFHPEYVHYERWEHWANRVGGADSPVLSHHRAYGSVHGGSVA